MNKVDYDKLFIAECAQKKGARLLLHCCCAPCATSVIERLKDSFEVTLYYFNPNIMPKSEYDLRAENLKKLAEINKLPLIIEDYQPECFLSFASDMKDCPEGGSRCASCIKMRIDRTCQYATEHGFDLFCSTLSVSPHKNAVIINAFGESADKDKWLHNDFKKRNGFLRSTELCREYGIYRQSYCGCRL